jgi:hypothetical protein
MAFRAILCVRVQPIRSLAVIGALFEPLLQHFTINWLMPLMAASETENHMAFAFDLATLSVRNLCDKTTVSTRAPFQRWAALKIRSLLGIKFNASLERNC